MRVSTLATLACVALLAVVGVDARSAIHRQNHGAYTGKHPGVIGNSSPHASTLHTAASRALFQKVTAELEARNYSRPQARSPADGVFGVDVSQWAGSDTWTCLQQQGQDFAIVRGYMESCEVDPNAVHTVANAWAAGMPHVDIYFYPSWTCGYSAATQVNQAIDNMGGIPFGTLWFDVEEDGAAGPDTDYNFLQAAVQQAVARIGGSRIGIYSSAYGWSVAMGDYANFQSFPIWYAHYDGSASFSDFSSFAGWTSPSMKQFSGNGDICSMGVDLNWFASNKQ